jgi:hypothetical protein
MAKYGKRNSWWLFEENEMKDDVIQAIEKFAKEVLNLDIKITEYKGKEPAGRFEQRIKYKASVEGLGIITFKSSRYSLVIDLSVPFVGVNGSSGPLLSIQPTGGSADMIDEVYVTVFESTLDHLLKNEF